jgi:hypothetical protein
MKSLRSMLRASPRDPERTKGIRQLMYRYLTDGPRRGVLTLPAQQLESRYDSQEP